MILHETRTEAPASGLVGLRGWLALVGVGFCLAPLRILRDVTQHARVLQSDTWAVLTTPGTAAYHPLWAPIILGEIVVNVGLLSVSVLAIYLFFKKRRAFPRVAIGLLVAGVTILVLDLLAVRLIPVAAAQVDADDIRGLGQATVGAAIWIPYFLRSKRVRATFVQ
ncbi:MAG TPA: DUF2569 domain-containing protein [Methylomirabilota bacterium]|jgi:hypothetical protein